AAVAFAHVGLAAGEEDDALVAADLVDRLGGAGVVGLRDQLDVQAVGPDVALVEVVTGHDRGGVAVAGVPADAGAPLAVHRRVDRPGAHVQARVAAGAVVEAGVVAVVRGRRHRVGRARGHLTDVAPVDPRSVRAGDLLPPERACAREGGVDHVDVVADTGAVRTLGAGLADGVVLGPHDRDGVAVLDPHAVAAQVRERVAEHLVVLAV